MARSLLLLVGNPRGLRGAPHTSKHRALVANASTQDLQKAFAHFGGEDGAALLLDRRRLGGTKGAHVVKVDHGIMGKGKVEGRA